MKGKIVLLVISLAFMFSSASAGNFKNINADELKVMLDKQTKMVLVDARPGPEYGDGHIPKAVNIPPEKVEVIGTLLPKYKKTPIVFYCRGAGWGLSMQAAVAAEKAGYMDIVLMPGGFPEWVSKGYKTAKWFLGLGRRGDV
jgi:rhodanese-related sulfurtransferase